MEMNGIAHVQLTVNDFDACRAFYSKLFAWLDMRVIFDSPQIFYGVGSRTGIATRIIHPPEEARWAPGYYSVLFEDPDGLRLEANFVPGKGNLASDAVLPLDVEKAARES